MNKETYQNKVVVITGASSGFGKGAALKLADLGCNLVLAARRDDALDNVAAACQSKDVRALAVPTDVSSSDEVANLAHQALSQFGRIDVWVNDAGVGSIGRFDEVPLADHRQVIETNLLGTLYGSWYALRQFHQQNGGILINVSSLLGKIPAPYYASYTASKYGVVGLGAVLRQELAQNAIKNISICTLMPMSNDTPFFDHAANRMGKEPQPIPPLYDPQGVIDTLVDLIANPRDEVIVGASGNVMNIMHNLFPGLVEGMMGKETHHTQEQAPAQEDAAASVHEPISEGQAVRGGRLQK
jgi:short-subunit dehydrogenase